MFPTCIAVFLAAWSIETSDTQRSLNKLGLDIHTHVQEMDYSMDLPLEILDLFQVWTFVTVNPSSARRGIQRFGWVWKSWWIHPMDQQGLLDARISQRDMQR